MGLIGQNLILNPGFEIYDHCPYSYLSKKNFLPYWYCPTNGTPDYYNKCSRGDADIPKNFAGKEEPKEGSGYVGIIAASRQYGKRFGWSREYIATKLKEELKKDSLYCISYYVSLSEYSRIAISQVDVYFSRRKINRISNKELKLDPQFKHDSTFLDSKAGWTNIKGIYKAKGNEKYIIIGNFQSDIDLTWIKVNDVFEKSPYSTTIHGAYYLIDDVSLELIDDKSKCECNKTDFTY